MTHILLNEAAYNAAMRPGTPQTVLCRTSGTAVTITKIRTGLVNYACSCGKTGLVFVEVETHG